MKEGSKQTVFFITVFALTAIALFVLQFSITGQVVFEDPCNGADLNNDGVVDDFDYKIFSSIYPRLLEDCDPAGTPDPCLGADLTEDKNVDNNDYNDFMKNYKAVGCIGTYGTTNLNCDNADLNKDGKIDYSDKTILNNLKGTNCGSDPENCQIADLNEDGKIDEIDENILEYCMEGPTDTPKVATPTTCTEAGYKCISSITQPSTGEGCTSNGLIFVSDFDCEAGYDCCQTQCEEKGYECILNDGTPYIPGERCNEIEAEHKSNFDESCGADYDCCERVLTPEKENACVKKGYTCANENPNGAEYSCKAKGNDWEWVGNLNYDLSCGGVESGCCRETSEDESPYYLSNSQFKSGITKTLEQDEKVKFRVEEKDGTFAYHSIKIIEITTNSVEIEVESRIQSATMEEDDIQKFDVTNDGYYDIIITLKEIDGDEIDMKIMSTHTKFTSEKQVDLKEDNTEAKKTQSEDKGEEPSKLWIYLIVLMIVLVIFVILLLILASKRKQKYSK